ncbi:glycosyltransferase, partial [Mycobacterium sp. E3198]|uniref:glycosyltransferase family 2 protein n=1 Tax=Mycobacterium sp. E3198 TaxID=1834143 RepID=UPI000ABA8E04
AAIASALLRPGDRLVKNQPRLGLNGNHNKCLELARGTCVQFVHGDDWLLPGALATLAPYFDDPTVGLAFAPRQVVGDDERWQRRYGKMHTRFRNLRERNDGPSLVRQVVLRGAKENWVGEPTCVMFRRRLALEAGGLRNDIYQLVDVDFWWRLMVRSTVCFLPRELSVRTHTATNESMHIVKAGGNWLDHP